MQAQFWEEKFPFYQMFNWCIFPYNLGYISNIQIFLAQKGWLENGFSTQI